MATATRSRNGSDPVPAPTPATPAPATDAAPATPAAPAPATDAVTADGAQVSAPALTPAQIRKQAAAKQAAALASKAPKFKPAEGEDWLDLPDAFGRAAVCLSAPNAAGESYYYVVQEVRGKAHAIPLHVVEALQEAGQI